MKRNRISFRNVPRRRRPWQPSQSEVLETRTLLSTFYVDGDYQGQQQDGSAAAPFSSIYDGVDAALRSPGDDTVIIRPRATAPYTEATAITPGYSPQQVRGFDVFDGDITIRGGGAGNGDVVIDTGFGHGFFVDAPINVTIENLTITRSGGAGIQNRSEATVIVDGVRIFDHPNNSGIVHQGANLVVRNSLLEENYQGLWVGSGNTNLVPDHLTVENTTSNNNRFHGFMVTNSSGVLEFSDVSANGNGFAGMRVNNSEVLTIDDATVSGNGRNGIVSHLNLTTTINNATVTGNGTHDYQYYPGGGGIHVRPGSANTVTISNSVVQNNLNWGNGGGIEVWAPDDLFQANTHISNTLVNGNAVPQNGSGTPNWGGGIAINGNSNLTLTDSTVAGNSARDGGGIYFNQRGYGSATPTTLTITGTTISGNSSVSLGGGLTAIGGYVSIGNSTISDNDGATGAAYLSVLGGDMTNVTVSGNQGASNGGLFVQTRYEYLIGNSTVTNNRGTYSGGLNSPTHSTTLVNSIVAGNVTDLGEDFPTPQTPEDLSGWITSLGHNIFGEAEGVNIVRGTQRGPAPTDITGTVSSPVAPVLGPLQDNGGPTFTHLPLDGSPAIDAADGSAEGAPATDQRGITRPQRYGNDIGAVEVENNAPNVSAASLTVTVDEGQTADQSGTYDDIDGDSVTLSATTGVVIDNGNGTWSWSLGTDDGPSDGTTVTVTATDQFGLSSTVDFDLFVTNVAPAAGISGPGSATQGDSTSFTLTASDVSAADMAAGFSFEVDWNGDGIVDETVSGNSGLTTSHSFGSVGEQTVNVRAVDKDGGVSAFTSHTINVIQPVSLLADAAINLNSADSGNKTFQIVISSTADFDARLVDVSSVFWAGAGVYRSQLKDIDKDGDKDLVLKFRLADTDLIDRYRTAMAADSSSSRKSFDIELTGRTSTGIDISGVTTLDLFMAGKSLRDLLNSL